jgi:hypothetical protein
MTPAEVDEVQEWLLKKYLKKIERHDLEQLQREAFVPPCTMYPRD